MGRLVLDVVIVGVVVTLVFRVVQVLSGGWPIAGVVHCLVLLVVIVGLVVWRMMLG